MAIQAAKETKSRETGEGSVASQRPKANSRFFSSRATRRLRVREAVHSKQPKISQSALARFSRSMKRDTSASSSTLKEFLHLYVFDTPADWYGAALVGGCCFLFYEVRRYVAPLDFQTGKLADADTPQSISIGLALWASGLEIGHTAMFLLGYALTVTLVWQVHARLVFLLLIFMLATPGFFFVGLYHQVSAIEAYVLVGSFHIRVFWFIILTALGFCFVFVLLVLISLSLLWAFKYKGKPEGKSVNLEDLSTIVLGV